MLSAGVNGALGVSVLARAVEVRLIGGACVYWTVQSIALAVLDPIRRREHDTVDHHVQVKLSSDADCFNEI